jgi:hypothetical protein
VTSGRQTLGYIAESNGAFVAISIGGAIVGTFPTVAAAMRAFPTERI